MSNNAVNTVWWRYLKARWWHDLVSCMHGTNAYLWNYWIISHHRLDNTYKGLVGNVIQNHYNDVIMSAITSQITSLTIVYSAVYSGTDQRNYQSSASLSFVREFTCHWWIPRTRASNAENVSFWWHFVIKETNSWNVNLPPIYTQWLELLTCKVHSLNY